MNSLLLTVATLFLLAENSLAERRCFANGDCFELIAWTPPCALAGKKGTGTVQFRLEHVAGVVSEYCVVPVVDWGATTERYDEKCKFDVDKNHTIEVKYEYPAAGTYTTKAKLNVRMGVFWPPDKSQFTSEKVAIAIGAEFCEELATVPPTGSPTMATSSPTTATPRPTPTPTLAPVVTEPPVGPIWNVAPPPPPSPTLAPTKLPTLWNVALTESPMAIPPTDDATTSSPMFSVEPETNDGNFFADESGANDERRTGAILFGQLFVLAICSLFLVW